MDWDYEVVMIPVCGKCLEAEGLEYFSRAVLFDGVVCAFCGKENSHGLIGVHEPRYWKKVESEKQEHQERHEFLHRCFDELFADFIVNAEGRLGNTIFDLLTWSAKQIERGDHLWKKGGVDDGKNVSA